MSRVTLGDVAIERKETLKGPKAGLPAIGLEHLIPKQITLTTWSNGSDNTFSKVFHKGQVLFGRRRAYLKKAVVAPFDGLCSGDITVIEAKAGLILPELLPLIIQNDVFFDYAVGKSAGSLSPRVKWEHLKKYEFELPDMEEQQKLAELLWSMVEAKEAYQELLRQTDELVKAQFVAQCQGIPEGSYRALDDICILITDGTHQPPKFVSQGIPFLLVSNITNNEVTYDTPKFITEETYVELSKRTPIEIGDILLSTVGSYGHPAIVKDNRRFSFQRHIAFLKPDHKQVNSIFLHTAILSPNVQEQIESFVLGVAQKTLNLSAIKKIRIPLPSLPFQERFVAFVQQTNESKFELGQAIRSLEAVYKKILSENLN